MSSILAIHSFRGGTGKSNLSANLATCLALSGKKVAIFDTDLASPGVHVLFGFEADASASISMIIYRKEFRSASVHMM